MPTIEDLEQRLGKLEDRDKADVMAKLKEIDEKMSKLKGDNIWRFVVQTILAPLTIVAVGLIVNWQIERNKAANDRIEAAREMIPLLFDNSPDKAFATEALLATIIDPDIADELHKIVARHYSAVIQTSLASGDTATAAKVLAAAEHSGGEAATVVVDSIKQNNVDYKRLQSFTNKSSVAETKEREGFQNLLAGNYNGAISAFQAAEKAYPSYHSVYEIARILQSRRIDLDDPLRRREILKEIATSYMVPSDLRQKMITQGDE